MNKAVDKLLEAMLETYEEDKLDGKEDRRESTEYC